MKHKKEGFVEKVALILLELVGGDYGVRFDAQGYELVDGEGKVVSRLELATADAVKHDPEMLAGFWFGNL